MNKLDVEVTKLRKRLTKAVRKYMECDFVAVSYTQFESFNSTDIHVWCDEDIVASVHLHNSETPNQIIQQVHEQLRLQNVEA